MNWGRRRRTVVVVDHGHASSGLTPGFLRQRGIRLVNARDDAEVLDIARRERPALIVDDAAGEDDAGKRLCERLKHDPATASIPLILVVGPQDVRRATESGADAVLRHPLSLRRYFEAASLFLPLPRRRSPRHPVNLRVTFKTDGREVQAFTRNLSVYGAFVKTDRPVDAGARLEMRFHLPGEPIETSCGGIVQYGESAIADARQPTGFAVEFDGLGREQERRLGAFIEQWSRRSVFSR